MKTIFLPGAKPPAGHYSPALVHNGLVFVSGLLPIDPETGEQEHGTIEAQTERVLQNLARLLAAAGSGLDQVLQVTVYIADIEQWGNVNAVYARHFGQHKPARTVVPTPPLHFGFSIEIAAIAALSPPPQSA